MLPGINLFPPREYLKFPRPQTTYFDMHIISTISIGEVITVGAGKLYVTEPVFSIDCGGLGAHFLTHFLLYVKRSLKVWPCLG